MIEAIVKVQLNLLDRKEVLVYDESRKHFYSGKADNRIIKAMRYKDKKYFYALIPEKKGVIKLLEEAPEQDW